MTLSRRLGPGGTRSFPLSPPRAERRMRDRGFCHLTLLPLVFTIVLAGCGKKGPPEPPPGEPATYPRPYPSE
jgi:predicted small lipoprotein YifL